MCMYESGHCLKSWVLCPFYYHKFVEIEWTQNLWLEAVGSWMGLGGWGVKLI